MGHDFSILVDLQRETREDVKEILSKIADISARTNSLEETVRDILPRVSSLEEPAKALRGAKRIGAVVGGIILAATSVLGFVKTFLTGTSSAGH